MNQKSRRILVAMSGGVDSSVVVALLQQAGHEVLGATLSLHRPNSFVPPAQQTAEQASPRNNGDVCGAESAIESAQRVARQLGIEHQVIDGRAPFETHVLAACWNAYAHGETPNPCVLCNRLVKLGLLLEHAQRVGAEAVATGHYARLVSSSVEPTDTELWRGVDPEKDQSYFLFALTAEQRRRTLFPLGGMCKVEVRELAKALSLASAERRESQDVCLPLGESSFAELLRGRFGAEAELGEFIDPSGRVLGIHGGVHRFTIGQRRGLGIALGQRAFVTRIDASTGRVTLSTNERDLWSTGLIADDVVLHARDWPECCSVQIRYRHRAVPARVAPLDDGRLRVDFEDPQRAVTPGQAVVAYDGDRVVGGGRIASALASR